MVKWFPIRGRVHLFETLGPATDTGFVLIREVELTVGSIWWIYLLYPSAVL